MYVTSKEDARQFALRYDLSVSQVRKAIEEGEWDKERFDNIREAKKKLYSRIDKQVEIQAELELKLQALEIIKIEQQVDFLMEHYAKYGDLFVRNPKTGIVELTLKGQPKVLDIPTSVQDVLKRKNMTELMQGYKKILKIQELEGDGTEVPDADTFELESGSKDQAKQLLNMAENTKKANE